MLDFLTETTWKNYSEVFVCGDGKLKFPETGTGRLPAIYKFESGSRSFIGGAKYGLPTRWGQFRDYRFPLADSGEMVEARITPWLLECVHTSGAGVYWLTAKDGPFTLGGHAVDLNNPVDLSAFTEWLIFSERPSENQPRLLAA